MYKGYSPEKSLLSAVCEIRQRAGIQTPFHLHINDVPTTVIVVSTDSLISEKYENL